MSLLVPSFSTFFMYTGAGNAFTQAAKLSLQLTNKHDAATHFVESGNCYRKGDAGGKGMRITLISLLILLVLPVWNKLTLCPHRPIGVTLKPFFCILTYRYATLESTNKLMIVIALKNFRYFCWFVTTCKEDFVLLVSS